MKLCSKKLQNLKWMIPLRPFGALWLWSFFRSISTFRTLKGPAVRNEAVEAEIRRAEIRLRGRLQSGANDRFKHKTPRNMIQTNNGRLAKLSWRFIVHDEQRVFRFDLTIDQMRVSGHEGGCKNPADVFMVYDFIISLRILLLNQHSKYSDINQICREFSLSPVVQFSILNKDEQAL